MDASLERSAPRLRSMMTEMLPRGELTKELREHAATIRADMARMNTDEAVAEARNETEEWFSEIDVDQVNEWIRLGDLNSLSHWLKFLDTNFHLRTDDQVRLIRLDIDWEDLVFIVGDGGDREHRSKPMHELERSLRIDFLNRLWSLFSFFDVNEHGDVTLDRLPEDSRPDVKEMERYFPIAQAILISIDQLKDRPKALESGRAGPGQARLPSGKEP